MKKALSFLIVFTLFQQIALGALLEASFWDSRRSALNKFKAGDNIRPKVPLQFAKVVEAHESGNPSRPSVVLIQDIHLNPEAQRNIATVILELIEREKISSVGVEGAFTPLRFERYRVFRNKMITKQTADTFLEKGLMAAPSYAGIVTAQEPPLFIGVDDEVHYRRNAAAFLSSLPQKKSIKKRLIGQKQKLAEDKIKTFHPALKHFDDLRIAYRKSDIGLGTYLKKLEAANSKAGFNPSLVQFLEAFDLETSLDFEKVEAEKKIVLEELTRTLSENELSRLLEIGLAYKRGWLGFGDYYREVVRLCEMKGVDLRKRPLFDKYVRYVFLSDAINAEALSVAVDEMESDIFEKQISSPMERELVAASRRVELAEKLIDFSLTPREWEDYLRLRREDHLLKDFEAFYQEAEIRSQKMVENLLRSSASHKAGKHILVVGGFHTPRMTELFKKRDVSYTVLAPRITKVETESGSAYLSLFAREKTPLQKLAEGEKLFINPERANVSDAWLGQLLFPGHLGLAHLAAGEPIPSGSGLRESSDGMLEISFEEENDVFVAKEQKDGYRPIEESPLGGAVFMVRAPAVLYLVFGVQWEMVFQGISPLLTHFLSASPLIIVFSLAVSGYVFSRFHTRKRWILAAVGIGLAIPFHLFPYDQAIFVSGLLHASYNLVALFVNWRSGREILPYASIHDSLGVAKSQWRSQLGQTRKFIEAIRGKADAIRALSKKFGDAMRIKDIEEKNRRVLEVYHERLKLMNELEGNIGSIIQRAREAYLKDIHSEGDVLVESLTTLAAQKNIDVGVKSMVATGMIELLDVGSDPALDWLLTGLQAEKAKSAFDPHVQGVNLLDYLEKLNVDRRTLRLCLLLIRRHSKRKEVLLKIIRDEKNQFIPELRISAYSWYLRRNPKDDRLEESLIVQLCDQAFSAMVTLSQQDNRVLDLFDTVYAQSEEARVYAVAAMLFVQQWGRLPSLHRSHAANKKAGKMKLKKNSHDSDSQMSIGGLFLHLDDIPPASHFLGLVSHEVIHNVLGLKDEKLEEFAAASFSPEIFGGKNTLMGRFFAHGDRYQDAAKAGYVVHEPHDAAHALYYAVETAVDGSAREGVFDGEFQPFRLFLHTLRLIKANQAQQMNFVQLGHALVAMHILEAGRTTQTVPSWEPFVPAADPEDLNKIPSVEELAKTAARVAGSKRSKGQSSRVLASVLDKKLKDSEIDQQYPWLYFFYTTVLVNWEIIYFLPTYAALLFFPGIGGAILALVFGALSAAAFSESHYHLDDEEKNRLLIVGFVFAVSLLTPWFIDSIYLTNLSAYFGWKIIFIPMVLHSVYNTLVLSGLLPKKWALASIRQSLLVNWILAINRGGSSLGLNRKLADLDEEMSYASWVNNAEQATQLISGVLKPGRKNTLLLGTDNTALSLDSRFAELIKEERLVIIHTHNPGSITLLDFLSAAQNRESLRNLAEGKIGFLALEGVLLPTNFFNLKKADWTYLKATYYFYLVTESLHAIEITKSMLPTWPEMWATLVAA